MSEMESHIGIIQQLQLLQDETVEDRCKKIAESRGIKDSGIYDWFEDYVVSEYSDIIIMDNKIYKVIKHQSMGEGDISRATRGFDGNIHFALQFYNSYIWFEEALEDAIVELERRERNNEIQN